MSRFYRLFISKSLKRDIMSSSCRNVPKIIELLSTDGSSGQHIEASKVDISSGFPCCFFPLIRILSVFITYYDMFLIFITRQKLGIAYSKIRSRPKWKCKFVHDHPASTLGKLYKKLSRMKATDSTCHAGSGAIWGNSWSQRKWCQRPWKWRKKSKDLR